MFGVARVQERRGGVSGFGSMEVNRACRALAAIVTTCHSLWDASEWVTRLSGRTLLRVQAFRIRSLIFFRRSCQHVGFTRLTPISMTFHGDGDDDGDIDG